MKRELFDYANAVLFTLAALLPIVNPLGSAPIFLSMTAGLPSTARRKLAMVVARYAFLLLTAAMLIGTYVLRIFGVSLPIVRVTGGLLVTANGWRLLNDDGAPGARPGPTHEKPHALFRECRGYRVFLARIFSISSMIRFISLIVRSSGSSVVMSTPASFSRSIGYFEPPADRNAR